MSVLSPHMAPVSLPANHHCNMQVVPFTAQKHNAVITGVANTLGDGVLASDISLAVLQDDSHVRCLQHMMLSQPYHGQIIRGRIFLCLVNKHALHASMIGSLFSVLITLKLACMCAVR